MIRSAKTSPSSPIPSRNSIKSEVLRLLIMRWDYETIKVREMNPMGRPAAVSHDDRL